MKNYIQTVLHPEIYHEGWLKPPFFEGWYFKLVDASRKNALAIIPGAFRKKSKTESHAFIQVLDGNTGDVRVFNFPYDKFKAAEASFDLRIGDNHFNRSGLDLNLQDGDGYLKGSLKFGEGQGWPVRMFSPGIMGLFGWTNLMECYHGLLSFDHALEGFLDVNGRRVDFDGGRGYIEKDWGKAFPHSWLWLQTNHFEQQGTSLSASVAIIPWLGFHFKGVIIGLWHNNRLYSFSTYNGARVLEFKLDVDEAHLTVKRGKWQLKIDAKRKGGGILQAPVPSGMDRRITESLEASVHVCLKEGNRTIFEDTGYRAGMEIVGDVDRLTGRV
ncbi:MAG: hypothetical protein MUO40_06075 [Anaerolineaceae bacterium]|nr:hypothetical protein [Anaerolineaceae bacterium]